MKLLGNLVAYVLVEDNPKKGSLILVDPVVKKIVSHVSDSVINVKVGDEIVTDGLSKFFEYNEKKYFFIFEENICAIIESK